MDQFVLLSISFVLGVGLRRLRVMPDNTPAVLNAFIINVSLPAVTLLHLHGLRLDPSLLAAALMPWLFFGAAFVLVVAMARKFLWSREVVGCLLLTAGFGNTSFVGLPMIQAYYGEEALGIGLVADQAGSFLALSTMGLVTAARYSSGAATPSVIVRRVLLFPSFPAALIALSTQSLPMPGVLQTVLARLGDTLTPLALLSVGMQLRVSSLDESRQPLLMGLLLKLVVLPALMLLVFVFVFRTEGLVLQVTIFEAAMPPMITGSILAMEHRLSDKLAALMVGVGIPLSFLTIPVWWYVLRHF